MRKLFGSHSAIALLLVLVLGTSAAIVPAMLFADTIRDNVNRVMSGSWTFTGTVTLPANCVDEDNLTTAALLPADNLVARFPVRIGQKSGTAVAAQTDVIHVAGFAGIVVGVDAVCSTAPTSTDTVTIDIQKSTSGGAFATILTSTIVLDNANSDRVAEAGTLDGTKDDYSADDVFQIVVTVSGTSAQGLDVTVFFEENPTS